jgi:hypothetical protein
MIFAISLGSIFAASIAVYLTTKIQDEVFKVGMTVVAMVFVLITLICAPWALKLLVVALPLLFGDFLNLSTY